MAWVLKTSGLDEEDAERVFSDKESAIDYAVVWFVSGYDPETNTTMRGNVPSGVADYTINLISDLKSGREFSCGLFYERAILEERP